MASSTASLAARISWMSVVTPTCELATNSTPSSVSSSIRRSTIALSSFIAGMPYIMRPPKRSSRSCTLTWWPRRLSRAAAARPAGPEPTTATRLPLRSRGGCGRTHPISKPLSAIAHSTLLIATGGSIRLSTQAPSQGAGQTRPVISGNSLVRARRSSASRQRSW
jgi:hypothetical protein